MLLVVAVVVMVLVVLVVLLVVVLVVGGSVMIVVVVVIVVGGIRNCAKFETEVVVHARFEVFDTSQSFKLNADVSIFFKIDLLTTIVPLAPPCLLVCLF